MKEVKFICAKHIDNTYITGFIRRKSRPGLCSYCKDGKERKVIEIDELGKYIQECFYTLYDDAAQWLGYNSREGGYQGTTYTTYELLGMHFDDLSFDIQDDLNMAIDDLAWCDYDPYGDSESDMLHYDWEDFKEIILHKQRYTFHLATKTYNIDFTYNVENILEDVSRIIRKLQLVKKIKAGTILYRCRQHNRNIKPNRAEDLCSPPDKDAIYANRMSPPGISMFYCALTANTAIKETVDESDRKRIWYTVGAFELKKDIQVIDLTRIPKAPDIFNNRGRKNYHSKAFMREFIRDLSQKTAKHSLKMHLDYVPTQIVTEYCRYVITKKYKTGIQGILYPSAVLDKQPSLVLFYDHEQSLQELTFIPDMLTTYKTKK